MFFERRGEDCALKEPLPMINSLALVAALLLVVCSLPAFAGDEIDLESSSGASIKFAGKDAGSLNVTFNTQDLVTTGFGTSASSGFYSIVNSGATVARETSCRSGCYIVNQTGAPAFRYGSTAGAGDLLTKNLFLVDIAQTDMGGGVFNDSLVINFVATGGSLQRALQIKFTTIQDLGTILSNHSVQMARVDSGPAFPVPEPASLAMMGAGLLGLAGICKKMFLAQPTV